MRELPNKDQPHQLTRAQKNQQSKSQKRLKDAGQFMKILDSPSSPMFGGNVSHSGEHTDEFDQLKRILFKGSNNQIKEVALTDVDQSS